MIVQQSIQGFQESKVLCSQSDIQNYIKQQEEQQRIQRLKEVRNQESRLTKESISNYQFRLSKEQEKAAMDREYQEYLHKQQLIRDLELKREQQLKLAGEAHRAAELANLAEQRREVERMQKQLNDQLNTQERGVKAIQRERQHQETKKQLQEQIKQIERKKKVLMEESLFAHEKAKEYRATERPQAQPVESKPIGKLFQLDYTQTRFHSTPVNVNVVCETAEAQQDAKQIALQQEKERRLAKEKRNEDMHKQLAKAAERGKSAVNAEMAMRDMQEFEKQMKRLQIQENLQRLTKKQQWGGQLVKEARAKKQKQKCEQMFEQQVIVQQSAATPPQFAEESDHSEQSPEQEVQTEIVQSQQMYRPPLASIYPVEQVTIMPENEVEMNFYGGAQRVEESEEIEIHLEHPRQTIADARSFIQQTYDQMEDEQDEPEIEDSRDEYPNFYKQVQATQLQTGHKKGIFDTYLGSGSESLLSPHIDNDSHLADEFLGLCQADLNQQQVQEQISYTKPLAQPAASTKIQLPDDVQPLFKVEEDQDLASAFLQRKAALAKKYGEPKAAEKQEKPQKTKEELAAIRKAMLKPKTVVEPPKVEVKIEEPGPPSQLGMKREISKKEMLALTCKNYDQLPEVQKRKQEQQKQEELKQRIKQVKELDAKRRQIVKK